MTPRLPFLVVMAAVGAVAYTSSDHVVDASRPVLDTASAPVAGLAAPAAQATTNAGTTWYCAGGDTVVVSNPTDRDVVGVVTAYAGEVAPEPASPDAPPAPSPADAATPTPVAPEPLEHAITVPAHDRVRFERDELLPAVDGDDAAGPLAAVVELDGGGVAAEQEVVGERGTDVAPCASATAPEWHFAWGQTTRDAREMLVLFNPFLSDVAVDGVFATAGGVREPLRWQGLVVPARSAVGVHVGQDVTRRDLVAATVQSRGGDLVAMRLQSFDGSGELAGKSLASGQPAPGATWTFAHGEVGDRSGERIVLYNPAETVAEADVTAGGDGSQPFSVVVRPGQVEVVDYAVEDRVARDAPHATVVQSRNGVPLVAERVVTSEDDVAAGPGMPQSATQWVLSAVPSGGDRPDDPNRVRLAVVNPDPIRPARLTVRTDRDGESSTPADLQGITVAPGARSELLVPQDKGTVVVLVEADEPVMVERVVMRRGLVTSVAPGIPLR